MATISIDIPTAQTDRVVNALAARIGVAVPGTSAEKQALVKSCIRTFLLDVTRNYETQEALRTISITDVDVT